MRTSYFFHVVSSSFYLFSYSSPNLSRRRLDVYHTSTHGVTLARIKDAGLKRAARGSLKYRTQKIAQNSLYRHHRTTLSGFFATKARRPIDNRKKLVKQQYLLCMFSQYGEHRPTNGWDRFTSLGHPSMFQRVSGIGFVTAATSVTGG